MTQDEEIMLLCHAMQSGIAAMLEHNIFDLASSKHLRVGVNMAMVADAGLIGLLIEKGICTIEEVKRHQIEAMKQEVAMYERELSEHFGRPVTLA